MINLVSLAIVGGILGYVGVLVASPLATINNFGSEQTLDGLHKVALACGIGIGRRDKVSYQ